MNIEQLRAVIQSLIGSVNGIVVRAHALQVFLEGLATALAPGPVSSVLDQTDIDNIVAAQTPTYEALVASLKSEVEAL